MGLILRGELGAFRQSRYFICSKVANTMAEMMNAAVTWKYDYYRVTIHSFL